jgi:hypothetical protein
MAYVFNPENLTRIDCDGKVKIPNTLRVLQEFEPGNIVEWSMDGRGFKLSKFHHLNQFKDVAQSVANAVGKLLELSAVVCNENEVIAISGLDDSFVNRLIHGIVVKSKDVYDCTEHEEIIEPVLGSNLQARFIQPIIYNDDIIGAIVVLAPRNFIKEAEDFSTETAIKLLDWCAEYLSNKVKELNI